MDNIECTDHQHIIDDSWSDVLTVIGAHLFLHVCVCMCICMCIPYIHTVTTFEYTDF